MLYQIDYARFAWDAVFVISTASAYWFFGGRNLAKAAIEQYAALVKAQKERIELLEAQLSEAQKLVLRLERRIKTLTELLARISKRTRKAAEALLAHDLNGDSDQT